MNANQSRILFIVPGPLQRRTGGSIYNLRLAENLKENGFHLKAVSVPDLSYFAGFAAGILISPWLLLKLLRLKPDLVIEDAWAHPALALFNVVLGLRSSSKLVMIVHLVRWREVSFGGSLARWVESTVLRPAGLIVAVSQFIKQEVERMTGRGIPTVVAWPGSDGAAGDGPDEAANNEERVVERRDSLPSASETASAGDRNTPYAGGNRLRLLFAGNCVRRKGLEDLIRALALVRDLPLLLDVAGSTHIEPHFSRRLVRLIDSFGLSGRVVFHGLVDSRTLARLYSSADIFVFPSHYEGYGIVLAEAMKAGLPIVASDSGPVAEILSNNDNAFIVPPRNSEALARGIKELAQDPAMRERFGRRSRELAVRLPSWRDTCGVVLEAIRRL